MSPIPLPAPEVVALIQQIPNAYSLLAPLPQGGGLRLVRDNQNWQANQHSGPWPEIDPKLSGEVEAVRLSYCYERGRTNRPRQMVTIPGPFGPGEMALLLGTLLAGPSESFCPTELGMPPVYDGAVSRWHRLHSATVPSNICGPTTAPWPVLRPVFLKQNVDFWTARETQNENTHVSS